LDSWLCFLYILHNKIIAGAKDFILMQKKMGLTTILKTNEQNIFSFGTSCLVVLEADAQQVVKIDNGARYEMAETKLNQWLQ